MNTCLVRHSNLIDRAGTQVSGDMLGYGIYDRSGALQVCFYCSLTPRLARCKTEIRIFEVQLSPFSCRSFPGAPIYPLTASLARHIYGYHQHDVPVLRTRKVPRRTSTEACPRSSTSHLSISTAAPRSTSRSRNGASCLFLRGLHELSLSASKLTFSVLSQRQSPRPAFHGGTSTFLRGCESLAHQLFKYHKPTLPIFHILVYDRSRAAHKESAHSQSGT
jgi:hypothetical protein